MENITSGGGSSAIDEKRIQALISRVTALERTVADLVNHAILDSDYPSNNS